MLGTRRAEGPARLALIEDLVARLLAARRSSFRSCPANGPIRKNDGPNSHTGEGSGLGLRIATTRPAWT